MGALTIGRVVIDEGFAPDPGMAWDGDGLSFSGVLSADSQTEIVAMREQMLGLAGNDDEPVVPVTWADDETIDGYYRVLSTSVGTVAASYTSFWFPFEIDLERVPNWRRPLIEVVCVGADKTIDGGATGVPKNGALNLPSQVWSNGYLTDSEDRLWTAEDTTEFNDQGAALRGCRPSSGDIYDTTAEFTLPPADYYVSSCVVEYQDAADEWRVLVGRQCPVSDARRVRISNGIFRARIAGPGGAGTDSHILVERYMHQDPGWDSYEVEVLPYSSGPDGDAGPLGVINVLRNTPEKVVVSTTLQGTGARDTTYTLSLERGMEFVEMTGKHGLGATVYFATNLAGDELEIATAPFGIKSDLTAESNWVYVLSPSDVVWDATNGTVTANTGIKTVNVCVAIRDGDTDTDRVPATAYSTDPTSKFFAGVYARQYISAY